MRALLIGLGGAGCRIVETLTTHDERSKVKSVRSYVFDSDPDLIYAMKSIDVEHRIVLSPSDPLKAEYEGGEDFDLSGLSDCFHEDGFGDIDGFFVCAGLGGRMADLLPRFISELEKVFPDPVFTILTLPARSEGVKVSTRAAEQLEAVREMGSACIVFDNETWGERIESASAAETAVKEGTSKTQPRKSQAELYAELNEILARRVGLLLRAGEVTHNGVESAEVVLDAGEVLNTLTGMDIVSIGYATEKLPKNMTGAFKRLFIEKYMLDEGYQRTSRIIDLAKKAVYEEVSVPCDLTSAEKALVLIAGPSEELSMKGFQMVRKWIDNSIRGIEMRAGDYPVKSTQYVGVIIVLAGIQNVPRIAELEEIRESYYQEVQKVYEGFEVEEEDIPRLMVASDDSIFEPGEVLPPGEYIPTLPETASAFPASETPKYLSAETCWALESAEQDADQLYETNDMTDDTIFTTDPAGYEVVDEDDLFEDTPLDVRPRKIPAFSETPAPASYTRTRPIQPVSAGAAAKNLGTIDMTGTKRAEKQDLGDISLPKREKKEDNVLSGMADLGRQNIPKDNDTVRIAQVQRPKDNDNVRISQVQRPKDNDDVRIAKVQRPKDADNGISAGTRQRPKDGDGTLRLTRVPKPKDYSEQVKVSAKKRAKEEESHDHSDLRWI